MSTFQRPGLDQNLPPLRNKKRERGREEGRKGGREEGREERGKENKEKDFTPYFKIKFN
jgi:hypothetical protein